MKKIINNLIYDTNDAYLVNIYHNSDFGFLNYYSVNEYLYLTKNNRFFLYKEESTLIFLSYDVDKDIIALSIDEAYEYMKKNCSEKLERYFKLSEA